MEGSQEMRIVRSSYFLAILRQVLGGTCHINTNDISGLFSCEFVKLSYIISGDDRKQCNNRRLSGYLQILETFPKVSARDE